MAFMILGILGVIIFAINGRVKAHSRGMLDQSKQDMTKIVENQLIILAGDISNYIISLETEIDKNMLNAAKVLREADEYEKGALSQAQLERLKEETRMSDLYIGDREGIFTLSTEKAALGVSLFGIWEGYRGLVTGQSEYLPSPFKVKVETGEIFKFTAIPRLGGRGILESALNTEDLRHYLERYIGRDTGVLSMNIFDSEPRTLTHNQAEGAKPWYTQGSAVSGSPEIRDLFQNPGNIKIILEAQEARIFYPVIAEGQVRYVLFLNVNTDSYFSVAQHIEGPLQTMVDDMGRLNFISWVAIFIALTLCTLFIGMMLTRVVKPLDYFNEILTALAKGDFSVKMDGKILGRKDESGLTAQAFKETIGQVGAMLGMLKQGMGDLRTAGGALETSAEDNQRQVKQIEGHIGEVTSQTDKQSENISRVSDSIAGIARNITALDGLITQQSDLITKSNEDTQALLASITAEQEVILGMSAEMGLLVKTSEESREKQGQLQEQIKNIYGLSEALNNTNRLISTIAAQTNLLSMNAAIEAAHAGAAGAGFAVVAGEIRKLAEDTTAHSKAVSAQVKEIQGGIDSVVAASNISRKSVENIIHYIEEVKAFITEASSSVDTQNEKSEAIRTQLSAITDLSGKVKGNASQMREESAAILSETRQAKDIFLSLQSRIHQMADNAEAIDSVSHSALAIAQETSQKITAISQQLDTFKV
jgi:methyl-accepting chemotaxis protein